MCLLFTKRLLTRTTSVIQVFQVLRRARRDGLRCNQPLHVDLSPDHFSQLPEIAQIAGFS